MRRPLTFTSSRSTAGALLALLLISSFAASARKSSAQSSRNDEIVIDSSAASHKFPHFWEQMFGSGRAILTLRDSYRRDMREVKQITEFRYVRFHAVLDDEV